MVGLAAPTSLVAMTTNHPTPSATADGVRDGTTRPVGAAGLLGMASLFAEGLSILLGQRGDGPGAGRGRPAARPGPHDMTVPLPRRP